MEASCSDVEPVERMENVLYAIDELTGLINATVTDATQAKV
jgi:predicted hydrolase (HD superfamily)